MNLNDSPVWIVLPFLLGSLYAYWLYPSGSSFPKTTQIILATARGLIVFILSWLLLEPSFHWVKSEEEKPEILFIQDNSASIISGSRKLYYQGLYKTQINELIQNLSKNFQVKSFSFGKNFSEGLPFRFNENQTNLSGGLDQIKDRFSGKNIGAIILATDGIFNFGENPEAELLRFHVPVYGLGLGDTARQKDIILNQVDYNEVVFSGDSFPIRASISAHNAQGENITVFLKQGGKILQKKRLQIPNSDAHLFTSFTETLKKPGTYPYEIDIAPISGETNEKNNSKSLFINVLKSQQNILLVSSVAHPDLSALKQALGASGRNKISIHNTQDKEFGAINTYSCIIEYQIPSGNDENHWIGQKKSLDNIPVLRILGNQTRSPHLDEQLGNLPFLARNISNLGRENVLNKDFRYFTLEDSLVNLVSRFPPLECPYYLGTGYSQDKVLASSILAGTHNQDSRPLILIEDNGIKKNAWILGEGIWKWRSYEFALTGNHHKVDGMLQKIIAFLTVEEDKSRFRIIRSKTLWSENEVIFLEAELYNKNFELIHSQPISLDLTNPNGKIFHFSFSPSGKIYSLVLGSLPVGSYTYRAEVKGLDLPETVKTGSIQVEASSLENENTQADHGSLQRISKESSANFFLPDKMQEIQSQILHNPNIRPVLHQRKGNLPWIDNGYLLILPLLLLTGEWGLRKWNGFY